jgi:type IX secretion system PorP/SprF family membrane protein
MGKRLIFAFLMLAGFQSFGQNELFPPDLRQHNLLAVSPQLFNPVFSLEQTQQNELAYWSRWQWQFPDHTPTTFLANYTHRTGDIAFGLGYFDNTTSIFKQRGVTANLAYNIRLSDEASLGVGANLFGYIQDREYRLLFRRNPALGYQRDLIVRIAPSMRFAYEKFGVSLGFENLPDFSLQRIGNEVGWGNKTYQLMADYTFSLASATGGSKSLRPIMYVKKVDGFDTQFGLTALFSSESYWLQGGLNSYYGGSLGMGLNLSDGLALGSLIELGNGKDKIPQVDTHNYTVELYARYRFGKPGSQTGGRRLGGSNDNSGDSNSLEITEVIDAVESSAIDQAKLDAALEQERARANASRKQDSIRMAQILSNQQQIIDSLKQARIISNEAGASSGTGRVYQEVAAEEGSESGYYLVANVFETERYLRAFMDDVRKLGIEPKSFYRRSNGYNYVYLERYDSFSEANRARESQFNGTYPAELWIFRVR